MKNAPSKRIPKVIKSHVVLYRWQELYDNHLEFFRKLFSIYENEFDYTRVLYGYTFFIVGKIDLFFGYMSEHFKKKSYILIFNEPLSPKFDLLVKRYSLLQSVVFGETVEHSFSNYDLSSPIYMIRSGLCNEKVIIPDQACSYI